MFPVARYSNIWGTWREAGAQRVAFQVMNDHENENKLVSMLGHRSLVKPNIPISDMRNVKKTKNNKVLFW